MNQFGLLEQVYCLNILGKTATPEYAEEVHANIRKLLPE
jgi:hypothetical protein